MEKSVMVDLEKIVCDLRSKEIYRDQLENIPYEDFGDQILVYKCLENEVGENTKKYTVTNAVLDHMGMSKKELHELAEHNTKRLFPPVIKGIDNYFLEDAFELEKNPDEKLNLMDGITKDENIVFLSNSIQRMASCYYIDETVMGRVSDYFEDDLIVLADADIASIIPLHNLAAYDFTMSDLNAFLSLNNDQLAKEEDKIMKEVMIWKKSDKKLVKLAQNDLEKCRNKTESFGIKNNKKRAL